MQLLKEFQPYKKLRKIDNNLLHTYFEYKLEIFRTDFIRRIIYTTKVFLRVDIKRFDIILGKAQFKEKKLLINKEMIIEHIVQKIIEQLY